MEISFSKYYENHIKYEPNFQVIMDHDSGYISHNHESNSDSSLENLIDTVSRASSKPIYLSEDALLEKPEVNIKLNLSTEIKKENYEETRNLFNSPDVVIPSSVTSQKTNYSGFENDSDLSNESMEIPTAKQIIIKNEYSIDGNESIYSAVKEEISIEENELINTFNLSEVEYKTSDIKLENKEEIMDIDNSSKFCGYNKSIDQFSNIGEKDEENTGLSALNNITNKCNISSENENRKKLTLIFSKCNKENVYSVKRKYHSISPDKNDTPENLNISLEKSLTPEEMEMSQADDVDKNSLKNVDIFKENKNSTENILINSISSDTTVILQDKITENIVTDPPKNYVVKKFLEQSNLNALSTTPEKKYKNTIDPNISPDLFGEEEIVQEQKNEGSTHSYIVEEKYIIKKDHKILKRVQNNLKGVLPPHSMTIIQMSINEMLNKLESNKEYFWTSSVAQKMDDDQNSDALNSSNEGDANGESKALLITGTLKDCIDNGWPEILEKRYHGLHYNRSKLSEEFEELCTKYAQRYVGAETQSSCTVFETNFVSPVKRKQLKQRWPVKSPGRRLSHLAKRRITFSSANLQAATSSTAGSRARQILVDAKRLNLLRKRSPRKSPRKTPRKSPRIKSRTPSSSAKKKLAMRFRQLTGEIEKTGNPSNSLTLSSKRKLFQSPDRDKNSSLFLPSTSGTSTFKNDLRNPNTKRALFISPSKNSPLRKSPFKKSPFKILEAGVEKKRKRSESDDTHPSKISKNVDIRPSESEVQGKLNKTASDFNISLNKSISQTGELSAVHKKKLQWAVYEALRSQNIAPSHAQFKIFASILARVTRRFLPNLANSSARPEGSTSERMLRIARHHVYAVVKGKSVDEIITEYLKNRSKNVKPQGYVGIEEFNERNKETANNKENSVQGRSKILESLERKKLEDLSKPKLGSENKIERIRKVINFGDDNR